MIINGTTGDDVLDDTARRDRLYGDEGFDVFVLNLDGKRDFIEDFDDGVDLIDLSDFDVTYEEVSIYQIDTYSYVIEIRGEKTEVNFQAPQIGDPAIMLTAEDFLFDPGAAPPGVNLVSDTVAADRLFGTGRPDVFLFNPDGERDAIRRFELSKDQIDITTYDTTFADLDIQNIKAGRVVINFGTEHLVIHDQSLLFVAEDFTAEDFIFAQEARGCRPN